MQFLKDGVQTVGPWVLSILIFMKTCKCMFHTQEV